MKCFGDESINHLAKMPSLANRPNSPVLFIIMEASDLIYKHLTKKAALPNASNDDLLRL